MDRVLVPSISLSERPYRIKSPHPSVQEQDPATSSSKDAPTQWLQKSAFSAFAKGWTYTFVTLSKPLRPVQKKLCQQLNLRPFARERLSP